MKPLHLFAASLTLLSVTPALAQTAPVQASATSPDGTVAVTLSTEGDGRAVYTVSRKGKPILAPSHLGFLFTDVAKIDRRLAITGPGGQRFRQHLGAALGRMADDPQPLSRAEGPLARKPPRSPACSRLRFRIYDDGVGFRYEFPSQPNMAKTNIADELTEFTFASEGTAWWKPAFCGTARNISTTRPRSRRSPPQRPRSRSSSPMARTWRCMKRRWSTIRG